MKKQYLLLAGMLLFFLNISAQVEIFTFTDCENCKKAISLLQKNKIEFVEYGIDDEDNMDYFGEVLSSIDESYDEDMEFPLFVIGEDVYYNIEDIEGFINEEFGVQPTNNDNPSNQVTPRNTNNESSVTSRKRKDSGKPGH